MKTLIFLLSLLVYSEAYPAGGYSVTFLYSFPEKAILGASLASPHAIAVHLDGTVFIADTGNNRIVKFDSNGQFLLAIGGFGWETEQFDRPLDLTAKTGLEVFVADFNNERIERYDKKLNYISTLRSDEILLESLQFGFPSGVDVSSQGELFICDTENNRILKLNTLGEPVLSFGDFNWGDGQLEDPVKVEVDRLVYVSDKAANQIVVFDYFGTYISRIGEGLLKNPNGLSCWNDRLLITDSGNHRMVIFDKNGEFVFAWGERGKKLGAFEYPLDVATFKGRIYVLDSGNNRVQVFELIRN